MRSYNLYLLIKVSRYFNPVSFLIFYYNCSGSSTTAESSTINARWIRSTPPGFYSSKLALTHTLNQTVNHYPKPMPHMCCASLRLPIVLTLQIYFCRSTQSTFTLLSKLRITLQQKIVFFEFFYAVTGSNFYAVTGSNFGAVTGSNFYAVTGSNPLRCYWKQLLRCYWKQLLPLLLEATLALLSKATLHYISNICIYFFSHKKPMAHIISIHKYIYTQVWINII